MTVTKKPRATRGARRGHGRGAELASGEVVGTRLDGVGNSSVSGGDAATRRLDSGRGAW